MNYGLSQSFPHERAIVKSKVAFALTYILILYNILLVNKIKYKWPY